MRSFAPPVQGAHDLWVPPVAFTLHAGSESMIFHRVNPSYRKNLLISHPTESHKRLFDRHRPPDDRCPEDLSDHSYQ